MHHRIFLVDDHPVVREGYASIIKRQSSLNICGEAATAEEALERIPEADPDLVVVDISLDDMSGLELLEHLGDYSEDLPVLMISVHDETLYAEQALQSGAKGYIMKNESDGSLVDAIMTILRGGIYLSDSMNSKLLLRKAGGKFDAQESPLDRLSEREREVFECLGQGLSRNQIGEKLSISPKTVGTYCRHIKEKLAIETTAKLQERAVLWVTSNSS